MIIQIRKRKINKIYLIINIEEYDYYNYFNLNYKIKLECERQKQIYHIMIILKFL